MKLMPTHTNVSSKIYVLSISAALIAVAMVFSYIENLIPLPVPIPGIKLGFANIVIIIALYVIGPKSAIVINLARILLTGLMFSGVSAMFYALAGGILSVIVMIILKQIKVFSIFGVSVGGASAHILGQILLASVVIQNSSILMLLPFLLISAVISGIIVGFISYMLQKNISYKKHVA